MCVKFIQSFGQVTVSSKFLARSLQTLLLRLFPGVLGPSLGAAVEGHVEDHPVGDGAGQKGDELLQSVRPVRRAPRLVPDVADGGTGVRLRRRHEEARVPDGRHLRRHIHGYLMTMHTKKLYIKGM